MATNRTFTMIKPEAVENGHIGAILERINAFWFYYRSNEKNSAYFRKSWKFMPFIKNAHFMETRKLHELGPIVAAILEKDNAVADFRTLIGATDPSEAAEGTIRSEFAESKAKNAIHGSDSDENAVSKATSFFCRGKILIKIII